MPSTLRTFRRAPILAVLLAASFGAHAQATAYKMRIPVGPIAAAAPAPDISIPGYNPVSGTFQSAQGSFTWNGTSYGVTTGTAFGITGPVVLTPVVTTDAIKTAIRDNPGSLAGTLAEGWLLASGVQLTADGLGFERPPSYGGVAADCHNSWYDTHGGPAGGDVAAWVAWCQASGLWGPSSCHSATLYTGGVPSRWDLIHISLYCYAGASAQPLAVGDWGSLSDPLPTVAPEMPYAPYLPAGVAVQNNFTIHRPGHRYRPQLHQRRLRLV